VRGVEYDRDAVEAARESFPDLDLVVGDVNALSEADTGDRQRDGAVASITDSAS